MRGIGGLRYLLLSSNFPALHPPMYSRFIIIVILSTLLFGCTEQNPDPDLGEVASMSQELLTDDTYKILIVEIAGDSSTFPSWRAIDNFRVFLSERLHKDKIDFRFKKIPKPGSSTVDLEAIKRFETFNRQKVTHGDTIFVWIEFLDAESSENISPDIMLGQEYGATSIAVFVKTLNRITLPDMVSRFTLETYILEHDFCHLLALVNNVTAMTSPHEDPDHKHHCSNPQCLMYWKADENMVLADLLGNDVLPVLDENCLHDLKAAGGK